MASLDLLPVQCALDGHFLWMCRKLFGSPVGLDLPVMSAGWQGICGVIEFKGVHYPRSVILHAVLSYG